MKVGVRSPGTTTVKVNMGMAGETLTLTDTPVTAKVIAYCQVLSESKEAATRTLSQEAVV